MRFEVEIDYYSGVRRPVARKSRAPFFRKQYLFFLLPVVIVVVTAGAFALKSYASVATLYPTTCLGGWEQSQLAQGVPETGDGASFSTENSAVLPDNTIAQLFCSNFQYEHKDNAVPTRITLHLALAARPPEVAAPTTTPAVDVPSGVVQGDSTTSEEVIPPPDTPAPPPDPAPDPAPVPDPEPTSLINMLIPIAHAETLDVPEVASSTEPASVPLSDFEAPSTTSDTQTASVVTALTPDTEPFIEVAITTDGTTWQTLGVIAAKDFADARFDIKVPEGFTWDELSHIAVSVQNVATPSAQPSVFLDGMSLEVEYTPLDAPKLNEAVDAASFQRSDSNFDTTNPVTSRLTFDPAPCDGGYYGFYWFGDGPTPYAFADIPIADIGKDFSREWPTTTPFIELAGVIISDVPFSMTTLALDPTDPLGVQWPEGAHICTPATVPLAGSAENPIERFEVANPTP